MDEILAYLKANPIYFLATTDAEGNTQVFYLANAHATISSFADEPKLFEF